MTDLEPTDSPLLAPGELVAALTLELDHEPVVAPQLVSGSPSTGYRTLDVVDGREIGVWEMTPGSGGDTEADEVFVVLSGRATVVFHEVPDATTPAPIELVPGAVVRLAAGMRTTWTVHETLRKVYIA